MEKIKLKIELLSKKIDIVKLLVFSAGIAGCWAFISSHYNNVDFLVIISLILIFVFGFGVGMNLLKFSDLTQKIDELDKELNNE